MPKASSPLFTASQLNRRAFLGSAGLAASAVLLTACGDDAPAPTVDPVLTLGQGDAGVLSYFFILERFSADFYDKVFTAPPAELTAADQALLRDISRHEVAHRELLTELFTQSGLVAAATVEVYRSVTFRYEAPTFVLTTRAGVLAGAQLVEDLTVAALTGALRLLSSPVYFRLALKMLAVESRHAALVRDLRQAGSFAAADVVAATGSEAGLNQILRPGQVVAELNKYSSVPLSAAGFSLT